MNHLPQVRLGKRTDLFSMLGTGSWQHAAAVERKLRLMSLMNVPSQPDLPKLHFHHKYVVRVLLRAMAASAASTKPPSRLFRGSAGLSRF